MNGRMDGKVVAVIGGGSGIGLRLAEQVVALGGRVVLGGRTAEPLDAAVARLGEAATARVVYAEDQGSVAGFFAGVAHLDHLFTPGSAYAYGRIDEISDAVAESPFRSKFWGQYWAVKHALPKLARDGSIVLMSGAASVRPLAGAAAYAACNAAVEGLGRALALELAPIRVNVVSPGTVDSDLWRRRPAAQREAAFAGYAGLAALGRVGAVDEVADAALFLMGNGFMTGSTLYADGGYALR